MFKNTPTSKIIAIKFSLYVVTVLIFFSILGNGLFLRQWMNGESKRLEQGNDMPPIPNPGIEDRGGKGFQGKFIRTMAESFPYTDELYQSLEKNKIYKKISKLDDEYVLYQKVGDTIKIAVVTRPIEAQRNMFLISLLGILFFGVLTYLGSRYFVKSSLYRLENLRNAVTGLDIDNLEITLPLEGPENDEVRIIGHKLQDSIKTIRQQTNALKDFVANASHELKTPLMQIGSQADYLIKAKSDYEDGLHAIKKTTKSMNHFIDNLLTLSKVESQDSIGNIPSIDISILAKNIALMHSTIYQEKNIELKTDIMEGVQKKILPQHFEIIMNNLISNAYKYTNKGNIIVSLHTNTIIVQDTGIGIKSHNAHKIWDKFRQEDSSKTDRSSYGLGLSLVKKIITLYKRNIEMESNDTGTTFTITMK